MVLISWATRQERPRRMVPAIRLLSKRSIDPLHFQFPLLTTPFP
jgi:hypothetical protein